MLAAGLSSIFKNSIGAQRSLELRGDREAVKQHLLGRVSCTKSFSPASCGGSGLTLLELLDKKGNSLVANDPAAPTRFGTWAVRAQCNVARDGVEVRIARLKPSGRLDSTAAADFLADPLTNQVYRWADADPKVDERSLLFPPGVTICPSAASGDVEHGKVTGVGPLSFLTINFKNTYLTPPTLSLAAVNIPGMDATTISIMSITNTSATIDVDSFGAGGVNFYGTIPAGKTVTVHYVAYSND